VRCYACDVCAVALCPLVSVCLSVTSLSSTQTAKHTFMQTKPYYSSGTLFSDAKDLGEIPVESPQMGHQNAGGVG